MEDNKSSPPDNLKEGLAEKALSALSKKYIVIGKTHVRAWKAWLAMGLVAGLITGIAYVANRSGDFEKSGAVSQSNNETEEPYEPGAVLVVFRKNTKDEDNEKILKNFGFKSVHKKSPFLEYKLEVPVGTEEEAIKALRKNPNVEMALKNGVLRFNLEPNDIYYSNGNEWWIKKIGLPEAWDITEGNSDIYIAIIDTGIYKDHEDISGKIVDETCVTTWCWSDLEHTVKSSQYSTDDRVNHGTLAAGVAAAKTNNMLGIASAGNKIKILNVRADATAASYKIPCTDLNACTMYVDDAAEGIMWAVNNGADVINIGAWNYKQCDINAYVDLYARWANSHDVPVFVGGGNILELFVCPNYSGIINVSMTDSSDNWILGSFGPMIDMAAPGKDILSTTYEGYYALYTGSTLSSPIVAGVAALMKSANPSLTVKSLEAILKCTAIDLDEPGYDVYSGWGRIDAYKAVSVAAGLSPNCESKDTVPPQISSLGISPIDQYQTVSGVVEISAAVSDESGIKEVEFYIDPPMDAPEFLASTDSSEPFTYTWDTTTVLDGTVVIRAIVKDNGGNINATSPRYVNAFNGITDTKAPAIRITSPAANSVITKSFTISAEAKDNVSVKKIDLFFDGGLMKTCTGTFTATTTCSISLSFRNLSSGTHTVRADAFDAIPNATSTQITVTSGSTTKGGGRK